MREPPAQPSATGLPLPPRRALRAAGAGSAGALGRAGVALVVAGALAGCAWKAYRPQPLDLPAADTVARSLTLDDEPTRVLLEAAGVDLRDWPALVWSRETLLLPLLDRHPDLQAARARVVAAWARVAAVQQRVNPELATRLENHSARGDNGSPWSIGAALQFTLNTRPLRAAQGGVAAAEAAEAEVAAGESAWRLYRQLGDALLAVQAAGEGHRLAQEAVALAEARVESATIRQRYGAAPALEVQLAQEALLAARRELASLDAATAVAQAQVAQALALPPAALARQRLAPWPVLAPQGEGEGEGGGPDAATARGIALRNRLDLAREVALYEVAEANVRLEVARQYPQVRLGPGLLWDQGDQVWQIGLALPLALFQRNLAAIEAAEARRAAQAAQVLARQTAVAGEVESARQRVAALVGPLLVARREAAAAETRVDLVRRQFDAGAADAATLIAARAVLLQARRQLHDSTVLWRQAQWALEAALQSPLRPADHAAAGGH